MQVLDNISTFTPNRGLCLTIGNFDGLHRGHQALVSRARQAAEERKLDFAVMTFWPHPRTVIGSVKPHIPLCERSERLRLLEKLGVPLVFELPFNKGLAAMPVRDFVNDKLLPLSLSHLVIGHDFSMGHNRDGNFGVLTKLGETLGFDLEQIPALSLDSMPVSSSRLRQTISDGDLATAEVMLGRRYAISGKIAHGDARGRLMGFPTANLSEIPVLIPGHGIYATFAHVDGKRLPAATSIGTNPTFDGKNTTVETFLLEGGGNLYERKMRLEFVARIREQRKFASAAELASQIRRDVDRAAEILAAKGD